MRGRPSTCRCCSKREGSLATTSWQLSELRAIVEAVEADFYRSFEQQARQRLRGRDEADWPILATALGLGCGLWTEDQDFFGTGVAVWTTNRIEILLEQEANASGSDGP